MQDIIFTGSEEWDWGIFGWVGVGVDGLNLPTTWSL